ncbi:MAG: alpha/beta hydrolase, partial [Muribaculaceae bacterium]
MKRYFAIALTLCMVMTAVCQDIVGSWAGKLNFGSSTLNLVFNISKADTGYKTTIDSPDQMAKGIPTDNTTFNDSVLSIGIKMLGASFSGTCVENDKIRGAFTQSGISLPIELSRQKAEALIKNRPQEPKAPFPYKIEEIIFENESAGIKLAGTLTMPSKGTKFPAVILVTGSGAQNRNEEIMGHKPFLVIADYLTRNGIAVLRYDDRGTAKSEGNFANATTADFATDAHAALKYLTSRKDINLKKIGII